MIYLRKSKKIIKKISDNFIMFNDVRGCALPGGGI
jgi:hypothetical protein